MITLILLLCTLFLITGLVLFLTFKLHHSISLIESVQNDIKKIREELFELIHQPQDHSLLLEIKSSLDVLKVASANHKSISTEDSAYKQALKMVEIGANLDDIISTCSLSRAEVQLLMNLKQFKSNSI